MDWETCKFYQDTGNRYLMLIFVSTHIPWYAISNLELRRSYRALPNDLVLPSTMTLSNIYWWDHALTMDPNKKQLASHDKVSLSLDR